MDDFDLRQWQGYQTAGGSLSQIPIINQVSIDSERIESPASVFIALKGAKDDGHHYLRRAKEAGAQFAIVSENYPSLIPGLTLLKVSNPLRALQEIAKTYRLQLPTKIVGITGSFGKTMVKDLLHLLLKTEKRTRSSPESFNSQIGVALSILSLRQTDEIAIIEAAVSEKGEMDLLTNMIQPNFTVLTPVGKKHLLTLNDLPTLFMELWKLIKATDPEGWSLIPSQSDYEPFYKDLKTSKFFWDSESLLLPHATLDLNCHKTYQVKFPEQSLFRGTIYSGHAYFLNLLNMAIKCAWLLGINRQNIEETLSSYRLESTRTEMWKSEAGVTIVNDCYCSDPQSIERSLDYFNCGSSALKKKFVFSGMREEPEHIQTAYRRIGKTISKAKLESVFLIGNKPFDSLTEELTTHSPKTNIIRLPNYDELFSQLNAYFSSEDFVVFKGKYKLSFNELMRSFNNSLPNNQCTINLAAIQTNLALIRKKLAPHTRVMMIIKALAYGTDDVRMAKFLAKCNVDIFGVSYVNEGVALKKAGIKQTIFCINVAPYEIEMAIKWELELGVSDADLIQAISEEAQKQKKLINVHLHINTGMGRFGCRPEEALSLAHQIIEKPSLHLEGIMTHFSSADDPQEDDFTRHQIHLFDQVVLELKQNGIHPPWIHAANSSGAIRFNLPQYNMVRIGLACYGLHSSEAVKNAIDLRLALSLSSHIVAINHCIEGETIGYGRRYKVTKKSQKIAVLPIGYFDGLHRNYSEKGYVLIQGHKAPMIGNICMDYMMVDVTEIPQADIGNQVLIFGEDEYGFYLSPEELAAKGNSVIHELITCLGPRISRIFLYEESTQIR